MIYLQIIRRGLRKSRKRDEALSKERKLQEAMISVKKKYGKNAMLKGMNLEEGATTISREQSDWRTQGIAATAVVLNRIFS